MKRERSRLTNLTLPASFEPASVKRERSRLTNYLYLTIIIGLLENCYPPTPFRLAGHRHGLGVFRGAIDYSCTKAQDLAYPSLGCFQHETTTKTSLHEEPDLHGQRLQE